MKKITASLLSTSLVFSLGTTVMADNSDNRLISESRATNAVEPYREPTEDITTEFAKKMRDNAAYMAYYAMNEEKQGTYPLATGKKFASKVKSRGEWDYKREYGTRTSYYFDSHFLYGEDLGNMHYGFVGRAAGFSKKILKVAAGAVQIYSGTSYIGWYDSYFDDPEDQEWIIFGIDMFDDNSLPTVRSLVETLSDEEKKAIEEEVKKDVEEIRKEKRNGM
ncbi:polymorphic toxin type 44 domain-containing protein [Brevibacillus laterosporus]|uniref:polymorphic toxin type 44 domain-containing protein n=1 Tax=Brevibacillus laterosporus TaxID=1465 RepID=UPI003D1B8A8D